MKVPDDFDPVKTGYLEREIAQVNQLFARLQEASKHREEFEVDSTYRAEWFGRVEAALSDEISRTMRAETQRTNRATHATP